MLQVRKRKRRGGGKKLLTLIILLTLAAGGAAVCFLLRENPEPMPVRTITGGALLPEQNGKAARIRIQLRGREPWTAVRDAEGNLTLEDAEGWTIDKTLAERIADAMENLTYEEILTEDPAEYRERLAEFGLADPELTAEVTYEDGQKITLRIGDASGPEDAVRYMTVDGDDRLFTVAESLMDDLRTERELLHPVTQPEIQAARLDRITILEGDGRIRAEWQLQGSITDSDAAASWTVTVPVSYPADQDRMSRLRKNAENLRLGLYVAEADDENVKRYGLDSPKAVIEIHMAAGSTGMVDENGAYGITDRPEQTVRVSVGSSRNEMTDYVLMNGVIYTMNHFSVETLTEPDPMDTLSRYPAAVPLEALSAMTIERADGSRTEYRIAASRETGEKEGDPDRIVYSCTRNGESYSWETFSAAYQRLMVVTVSGKLPEGWKKQETEIRCVFRTVSGKNHTVELSPFDAMHDAVTVDGQTVFYLIRGGMDLTL